MKLLLLLPCVAALKQQQQQLLNQDFDPGSPGYYPDHLVRLMAVASTGTNTPFLSAVVTTKDDKIVVAAIPNGDPPTAFNKTDERGFQAQNGKYIFFDPQRRRVRLDNQPHNETQYIYSAGGTISTIAGSAAGMDLYLCPESGSIYSLGFMDDCGLGWEIQLYPITPQSLTGLWENTTLYPLPRQKGWLDSNMSAVELGDNSTFNPSQLSGFTVAGAGQTETSRILWALVLVLLVW
ncbi:hypothetical protein CJU89_6097 [Yarrowia sp. B02]|nr:hypothetical protein CJU89_6097 [Yarrowia sp. B02]